MFCRLAILPIVLIACAPDADPADADAIDTGAAADVLSFVDLAEDGYSVAAVEPERYLGVWYEIATTPSSQQRNCAGTTAEYSLRDDGDINVLNRCYVGDLDGRLSEIEGTASFQDNTYARLLVDFGFGFEAPYFVAELDGSAGNEPYEFALVSTPGSALWVLSRTPQLDTEIYEALIARAEANDLPVDELIETEQPL